MKKTFAAVLAAMMMLTAGTAMAAEFPHFDFNGDLKMHYRWNGNDVKGSSEGGKVWFRLNATSQLSDATSVFARFATQKLTGDHTGNDFDSAYYGVDHASSIDRFGLAFKDNGFTYSVGRLGVTVGTGLFADSNGYMGKTTGNGDFSCSAIEGLTVTGKAGVTNLQVVAGKAWTDAANDPELYSVHANYSPAKNWTLGGTLARTKANSNSTNYWAVNAGYAAGKANYFADYGKSNEDTENTAYVLGVAYAFDSKNSGYVIYSKVEGNADMGVNMTAYDDDGKGMYYGFDRKLDANKTLSFFYKDMEAASTGDKYDSLRTTLTFQF